LPGPNYHCRPHSPSYNPPHGSQLWTRLDAFGGCGDLVFSSHTIFVVLCVLTVWKYSTHLPYTTQQPSLRPQHITVLSDLSCDTLAPTTMTASISPHLSLNSSRARFVRRCVITTGAICVCVFGILVVMARKHYSLDVVVACYTVPLLWLSYDRFVKDVEVGDMVETCGAGTTVVGSRVPPEIVLVGPGTGTGSGLGKDRHKHGNKKHKKHRAHSHHPLAPPSTRPSRFPRPTRLHRCHSSNSTLNYTHSHSPFISSADTVSSSSFSFPLLSSPSLHRQGQGEQGHLHQLEKDTTRQTDGKDKGTADTRRDIL